MAKPRRATFTIATSDDLRGNRDSRTGYTLGDFGVHKDRYFWTVTHLPTGMGVNVWPCLETKAAACAYLEKVAAEGLAPHQQAMVDLAVEKRAGLLAG